MYKHCADTVFPCNGSVLVQSPTDGMKIQADVEDACLIFCPHGIEKYRKREREEKDNNELTFKFYLNK